MKINVENLFFEVEFNPSEINHNIPVLFLHGFTGSMEDWNFIKNKLPDGYSPVLIDLLGHGKSSSPPEQINYTPDSQVFLLKGVLDRLNIEKLILIGYSMGGRLALCFAETFPEQILGIISESTSFGIQSDKERGERVETDEKLAEKIGQLKLEEFIDYWLSIPLFKSLKALPVEKYQELRNRKIKTNNREGLKNSLLGFSTGRMKYLIPNLSIFNFKLLLLSGEFDQKYCEISAFAREQLSNCDLKIIKKTGHNIHFEKPGEFLKLINDFLINIRDSE
jgi:2-succinyl-6-hydroxy-2,4-cyclohexadiene-1-carboxylate synthase